MRKIGLLIVLLSVALVFSPVIGFSAEKMDQQQTNTMNQNNQSANAANQGNTSSEAENIVQSATLALRDMMNNPQQNIPPYVLQHAAGIAIIPSVVKAGLIVGGRHGTGVLVSHHQNEWSPPVFVSVTGGSVGAQAGVETTDLVMVFNNQATLNKLITTNNFRVGVDASAAAGPAGSKAKASTSKADILTYRRTGGLFAGVSLTGAVLTIDKDPLMAYYNINQNNARGYYQSEEKLSQEILQTNAQQQKPQINVPQSAEKLQDVLQKYASMK